MSICLPDLRAAPAPPYESGQGRNAAHVSPAFRFSAAPFPAPPPIRRNFHVRTPRTQSPHAASRRTGSTPARHGTRCPGGVPPHGRRRPRREDALPGTARRAAGGTPGTSARRQRRRPFRRARGGAGCSPSGPSCPDGSNHPRNGGRLPFRRGPARPRGRDGQPVAAPQRAAGGPHAGAAGRGEHDLRGAPERHHRRLHPLSESGQRRAAARRLRGAALQPRPRLPAERGSGRGGPARRGGSAH